MGLFDLLKKLGRRDDSDVHRVKINPIVQKDVDPFATWEKKNKLGDGSYGEIYRCVRFDSGQEAAIKQIAIEGEEDLEEYMVEIDILVKCKHPKIVGLYEAFLFDSTLWLCLEFCKFGALDNVMIELDKGLSERQIQLVCHELCDALAFLHSSGVIHRDLKAGNILLTGDAMIKLADFGVSAMGDSPHIKRHSFIGSNYWMSPEVMACETYTDMPYGCKTDVWSLGITLIELAQMLPPNHTMQPMRVAIRILKGDPPTLERPRKWSKDFNDFLTKALTKSADLRPSVRELQHHPFLSAVTEDFRRDLRDLIAEFQTTPEVEMEEVNVEEPAQMSGIRDSVYSFAGLEAQESPEPQTPEAIEEEDPKDLTMNETKESVVFEPEAPQVAAKPSPPPLIVEPSPEAAPPSLPDEPTPKTPTKSTTPSTSSSVVEPPPEFKSPLLETPKKALQHSKSLDSIAGPEEKPEVFRHPPVVARSASKDVVHRKKKPPAPLPKSQSMRKSTSSPSVSNGDVGAMVAPSPIFKASQKPQVLNAWTDEVVSSESPMPGTNLKHHSYLCDVTSSRSSIASETIESGDEEQKSSEEEVSASVDEIITEVLVDENRDPSVYVVVLDVMQEEYSSVTDIDEMINSTFDLAIAGHEQPSPVTDIDAVVVTSDSDLSLSAKTDATPVPAADVNSRGDTQKVVGLGTVSARVTKDYSQEMANGGVKEDKQESPDSSLSASNSSASFGKTLDVQDHQPAVTRRKKEDRFNSVVIKKKRVFTDESGKQVVSTTTRTVRKGEENRLHDHIINRRQELREQKLLNKQHQKQDMEFKLKANMEESSLEVRFKNERAQIHREFDNNCQKVRRDFDDEERVQKANLDRLLKSETNRWKQHHDRSLRDFRENMRKQRKQVEGTTSRDSWKDSIRSQTKEREREAEKSYVNRLIQERAEKEVQIQAEYQKRCDERRLNLSKELQNRERRFLQERHEQEERHIYERYELKQQHLVEYFTLKKSQAIQKHERELEQIRRYYEGKRQTLLESHTQEKKLKPKLLRKEKLTREKMFKASLDMRSPPLTDQEMLAKIREFDENESVRMQSEMRRMDKKLEQMRDDFERRVARIDSEVRQAQNEKRQMIILKETDQKKDLELTKKAELKEFNSRRVAEREQLEKRLHTELQALLEEQRTQAEESAIRVSSQGSPVTSRTLTSA